MADCPVHSLGEMFEEGQNERRRRWIESMELVRESEKMLEMLRQAVLGSEDGTIMGQAARQAWAALRLMLVHLAPGSVLDTCPRDPLQKKVRNQRKALRGLQRKLGDLRYGVEHRKELEQLGAFERKARNHADWARAANEAHAETRSELSAVQTKLSALVDALAREGTMGDRSEDVQKAFEAALVR